MASARQSQKRAPVAQHSAQCALCRKTYTGPADTELFDACELCLQEVCEKCSAHTWLSCDGCDNVLRVLKNDLQGLNDDRKLQGLPPRTLQSVLVDAVGGVIKERMALLKD